MILSHRHRFIFIKGLKVASTSVEIALSQICGPEDIITPITPVDEALRIGCGAGARNYSSSPAMETAWLQAVRTTLQQDMGQLRLPEGDYVNHMSLVEVVQRKGAAVKGYRVVCVERNPYAKVISWANHMLTVSAYKSGAGEMRADPEMLRRYLDRMAADGRIVAARNIDRYRGPDGRVTAEVLRYERLSQAFRTFVRSLGIMTDLPLPHVKKGIQANDLDPLRVLTRPAVARINELFSEEFAAFGYEQL